MTNPQPIDFDAIEQAAYDAAYDIKEMVVDLEGEVILAPCADCNGEERTFLELETGQRFEIRKAPPAVGPAVLQLEVFDWKTQHVYMCLRSQS